MRFARVDGIDAEGDFPYEPVENYAKAHGKMPLLKAADDQIATQVARYDGLLARGTIADVLRSINDPESESRGNDFYRTTLKIGSGTNQPGADLLTAWYKRNFHICANGFARDRGCNKRTSADAHMGGRHAPANLDNLEIECFCGFLPGPIVAWANAGHVAGS